MKNQNNSTLVICFSLALALAVVVALWLPAQFRSAKSMDGKMMTGTEAMQEQRAKVMAVINLQDSQLAGQIYEMNNAATDKKLDLMAAIVTRMAAQRTDMNARIETMHKAMVKNIQMDQENMSSNSIMQGIDTNSMGDGKPMSPAAMMAEMKVQGAILDRQIYEMNRSPADKKLDLMAAVLTQMAAQRRTAYLRMENMRGELMQLRQMGKEPISPDSMMKGIN